MIADSLYLIIDRRKFTKQIEKETKAFDITDLVHLNSRIFPIAILSTFSSSAREQFGNYKTVSAA